jgi:hypothetical protein
LVPEGDRAFARMLFEGIPTVRSWALKSDKIASLWVLGDVHGLREQLQRNAEH